MTRTLSNGWTLGLEMIERTDDKMRTVGIIINGQQVLRTMPSFGGLYSIKSPPPGLPATVAALVHCWVGETAAKVGLTHDELSAINGWLKDEEKIMKSRQAASAARQRKAREYDRGMNEGGEGYNPYRDSDCGDCGDNSPYQKGDLDE